MEDKNYIYKRLADGRYIKEVDNKVEHLATAEEDAKLATDIRSLLQGPQGEAGTSGTSGVNGTSGRDGAEGRIGRTGLTGPRGLNGTSGSSGSSGQNGTSGVNGEKGDRGDRGFKGEKGDRGDKGFPGIAGPSGQNGTSGIGVPSGGTSGQVLAKIDGTDYNTQWVNQSGGGGSGSSGTSGSSGSSGVNGSTGPMGPTGPAGSSGGGGSVIRLSSQTLATSGWNATGSYYGYTFSNANIGTASNVDFIPYNDYSFTTLAAGVQPYILPLSGSAIIYSQYIPSSSIVGDFIITQTI